MSVVCFVSLQCELEMLTVSACIWCTTYVCLVLWFSNVTCFLLLYCYVCCSLSLITYWCVLWVQVEIAQWHQHWCKLFPAMKYAVCLISFTIFCFLYLSLVYFLMNLVCWCYVLLLLHFLSECEIKLLSFLVVCCLWHVVMEGCLIPQWLEFNLKSYEVSFIAHHLCGREFSMLCYLFTVLFISGFCILASLLMYFYKWIAIMYRPGWDRDAVLSYTVCMFLSQLFLQSWKRWYGVASSGFKCSDSLWFFFKVTVSDMPAGMVDSFQIWMAILNI